MAYSATLRYNDVDRTEDFMTLPVIGELAKGAIVRTSYGEEMRIINPAIGEVLRTGNGSVSYESPESTVTHFCNDLDIWKPFAVGVDSDSHLRIPPKPEDLVDALQGNIHKDIGQSRPAKTTRKKS